MRNDKPIEILVKTVFTGRKSAEQAFIDLMRSRISINWTNEVELMPNQMYNGVVVFPGVHAPERGVSNG
jgi:hypothetical protein